MRSAVDPARRPVLLGKPEHFPDNPRTLATAAVEQFAFSRDRNPDVIEKVPEAPIPALPVVYGTILVGDSPAIFLGFGSSTQHAYHAGEQVGPFRLIGFDFANVTFEWNGRQIERSIHELAAKQEPGMSREPAQTILAAIPAASRSLPGNAQAESPQMGPELGESERACVEGDQQPAGTVTPDGFRKTVTRMPFGEVCRWVK